MDKDDWTRTLLNILNQRTLSSVWTTDTIDGMNTHQIYAALQHLEEDRNRMYASKKPMTDTRSGDVAQAALEALEAGISLEELLQANKTVRVWYGQMKADREKMALARQREAERQRKLEEKKRLEAEARAAVASKLTPEELEAFGLSKKGVKK